MGAKNSLFLLAAIAGLTIATVGCQQEIPPVADWQPIKLDNGNFTINYPGAPKRQVKSEQTVIGKIDIEMYVLEYPGEMSFFAGASTYPVPASQFDPEAGLEGGITTAAQNIGGTIQSKESLTKDGMPGREAIIHVPGKKMYVRMVMYCQPSGPSMYQANVVSDSLEMVNGDQADAFFDSMAIHQ